VVPQADRTSQSGGDVPPSPNPINAKPRGDVPPPPKPIEQPKPVADVPPSRSHRAAETGG